MHGNSSGTQRKGEGPPLEAATEQRSDDRDRTLVCVW
jgi:hypothetical protein